MAKFRLETRGRNPTQSGARAAGIVERLQIGKHIALRRRPGGILPQVNPLTLKTAEEVFGNGVIVGITSAGHALADTIGHQPFPIEALDAYCTPRSLWKISPFGGLRRRYAISRAVSASCVSIRSESLFKISGRSV